MYDGQITPRNDSPDSPSFLLEGGDFSNELPLKDTLRRFSSSDIPTKEDSETFEYKTMTKTRSKSVGTGISELTKHSPRKIKILELAIECFAWRKANDGAVHFVNKVLGRKLKKMPIRDISDVFQKRFEIYQLMQWYISAFEKIGIELRKIQKIDINEKGMERIQQWFQKPALWSDMVEDGLKMLPEERDRSAPFSRKKSLRKFIADMEAIKKDGRMKSILFAAMGGKEITEAVLSVLNETELRRETIQPLLNQRHFIRETKKVSCPISHISPREILSTLSRSKQLTDKVGVAYEQIIIHRKGEKDPKDFIIIKPEPSETNEDWYIRLLTAIYVKGFGSKKFTKKKIVNQVHFLFSFLEGHSINAIKGSSQNSLDFHFGKKKKGCIKGTDEVSGEESYDKVLLKLPTFHILQGLTNNAAAVMFCAARISGLS